jgi:hypothetical protein
MDLGSDAHLPGDHRGRAGFLRRAGPGLDLGWTWAGPEGPSLRPARPAGVSPQSRMRVQQAIASLVPKLCSLRQPVIAAVNGPAFTRDHREQLAAFLEKRPARDTHE